MSIVVPEQKRSWLLAGAAVALVLAVGTTIVLVDLPGEQLLSRGGSSAGVTPVVPDLPQAPWEISIHASGLSGKMPPAQRKALDRQRPEVRSLVMRVYDSLFVHPNRLADTLKENFSGPAAAALQRANAGATEAGQASTTLRKADIGIQAFGGGRMAVASVTIRATAEDADGPVLHRSALWMERATDGWKVVAFDVRQGPVPTGTGEKEKGKRP